MMIISCLPQIWRALGFLKHVGKEPSELPQSVEQNAPLEYSSSGPPSLPQTIPTGNERNSERIRLLVTVPTDRLSSPLSTKPIITNSDCSYGSTNSVHRPSPSSPSHLVPPSPVRSISESSESGDSIISIDNLTSPGGSVCSNADDGDRPCAESTSSLEDALSEARLEWPEGEIRYFLPADAIVALITVESIAEELRLRNAKLPAGQSYHLLATRIARFAPKLFCILVLLRKACCIIEFLEENLDDSDLPFNRDGKTRRSGNFRLCSNLHENQPIKSMSRWPSNWIKDFSREQWSVITPTFKRSDTIQHYNFHNNSVFPYTRDEERNEDQVKEGGFGRVWEIEIHPAYHSFYTNPENSEALSPSFALKRLHSKNRDVFESEVKMLKMFSESRQHAHLIKLLATYEFQGSFYLLFPYAKANLRDYWKQTPIPEFSDFTVKWFLRQCKGIASAVQRIHGYQSTLDASEDLARIKSSPDVTESSFPDAEGRFYGRHGDIKPENILWSDEDTLDEDHRFNEQGILLITDFGLMKTHKTLTQNRVLSEQAAGSAPYEPPEVAEPRVCTTASRSHDIWSLGCVYLEFITWLIGTLRDLEHFQDIRSVTWNGHTDETFFRLVDAGLSGRPREAVVKESVQEWIAQLHSKPRCSEFVHDFVNLISRHMLVPDPKARIHCGPLNEKLTGMVKRAEEDSNYLVPRDPLLVQRWGADTQLPPNPKNGSPLPKRPSVANKLYTLERSRTLPRIDWQPLSQPSSPNSSRYFQGLVGYS